MVLRTLDVLGPQHGYGIAKRIEQVSADMLVVNHGTLYPVLLKLEQEGLIATKWGVSENNRRAKFIDHHNGSRGSDGAAPLGTDRRDHRQVLRPER